MEQGKSLRYSTWIGRGFFKMLQISLFGVSINIIVHVFSVFVQKKFVSIRGVLIFFTKPWIYTRKSQLVCGQLVLCICGSIFAFLDIF
jgi:hypothetical protein